MANAQRVVLITGAAGLVGSACARAFHAAGWSVVGYDNDARAEYFGPGASTDAERVRLLAEGALWRWYSADITDDRRVFGAVVECKPDAIVHAAAQPSHDKAAEIPLRDFDVNARGTLLLLEAARRTCPTAPFIFLSTNKVYGDLPNRIHVRETPTRYEWEGGNPAPGWGDNIEDGGVIDGCMHSLFGCSKAAADLYVQEYGRYFGLPTVCLRAGCLTGPAHAGAEQHGFLAYLARCIATGTPYRVYGHGGKQVRDNLHAEDLARLILLMCEAPPGPGAVYNVGGGYENSCSIIEAATALSAYLGPVARCEMGHPARKGDHVVYYTCLQRVRAAYPTWRIEKNLDAIYSDLAAANRKEA